MRKLGFEAPLVQGHKGVTVVIVPFDPEEVLSRKPVRLDPRRDGWLVRGTLNRARFVGYIGQRWGRFFIIIEPSVRSAAKVEVGDTVSVVIEPTFTAAALEKARALSKVTTAPKKGRSDALELTDARTRTKATARPRAAGSPSRGRRTTRSRKA